MKPHFVLLIAALLLSPFASAQQSECTSAPALAVDRPLYDATPERSFTVTGTVQNTNPPECPALPYALSAAVEPAGYIVGDVFALPTNSENAVVLRSGERRVFTLTVAAAQDAADAVGTIIARNAYSQAGSASFSIAVPSAGNLVARSAPSKSTAGLNVAFAVALLVVLVAIATAFLEYSGPARGKPGRRRTYAKRGRAGRGR
ncbi:hypothetical protein HY995_02700 [Candidatus Micrarchaeota archaeon]|nr:hypothetical protein [Candidatus Micrarchaeota archaeon]